MSVLTIILIINGNSDNQYIEKGTFFNYVIKNKKYNYWKATRKSINGYKYVEIGNGIYENSAISRMKNNKDVFCSSKSKAKSIAKRAGNGKKPVGPEIDRGKNSVARFYYHYHPHARMYQSHSFYA